MLSLSEDDFRCIQMIPSRYRLGLHLFRIYLAYSWRKFNVTSSQSILFIELYLVPGPCAQLLRAVVK